jgi:hypothetical protein
MLNGMLTVGEEMRSASGSMSCRVDTKLDAGGQGEVYRVTVDGSRLALKCYYPHARWNLAGALQSPHGLMIHFGRTRGTIWAEKVI